jgi:hypothetical protein
MAKSIKMSWRVRQFDGSDAPASEAEARIALVLLAMALANSAMQKSDRRAAIRDSPWSVTAGLAFTRGSSDQQEGALDELARTDRR